MGGRSVVPGRGARMKLGLRKGDKRELTGFALGCEGLGVVGPGWCSCLGCRSELSCTARSLCGCVARVGGHAVLERGLEVR